MKLTYGLALAAALIFGCSSSNKNTKTASSENPNGTTQPSSIEGTGSTAGASATNTQGTSTATNAQAANNSVPSSDTVAQPATPSPSSGSSAVTTPSDTSNSTASGSTYGQSSSGISGSTSGTSGAIAATPAPDLQSGATAGSTVGNPDSFKTVTGSVAKVDQNSITLDQSAGGVTLTVDSNTQVLRRGQPIAAGISAIHEGEQVRASFDPASNRADKIEVMGRHKMHHKAGSSMNTPSDSNAPADSAAPAAPADSTSPSTPR